MFVDVRRARILVINIARHLMIFDSRGNVVTPIDFAMDRSCRGFLAPTPLLTLGECRRHLMNAATPNPPPPPSAFSSPGRLMKLRFIYVESIYAEYHEVFSGTSLFKIAIYPHTSVHSSPHIWGLFFFPTRHIPTVIDSCDDLCTRSTLETGRSTAERWACRR